MYGKVFSSLWDGTLATNWPGWSLLVFMIANCDPDGTIDMTPEAMAARTGIPLVEVHLALDHLSSPDLRSRSQEEEGRRIVLLDPENRNWGWSIVNYRKYREFTDAETIRKQNRIRKQKQRDTSRYVTHGHASSRQAEAEAEAEEENLNTCSSEMSDEDDDEITETEWFEQFFWTLYPRKVGKAKALKALLSSLKATPPDRKESLGDEILSGLKKYLISWEGKDVEFIPHPATWLNQRRWEDEL